MLDLFKKLLKDPNQKELEKLWPMVEKVNSLEAEVQALSDEELRGKTDEFRNRLTGEETIEDILPEAFAVVREAAQRSTEEKFRHFDVQILGGIVLHQGKIAEMKTGEGKTLVATLPAYLNALTGKSVHIITVNEYLARRDAEWMGSIYKFLGLTVGLTLHGMDYKEKKEAYSCDIVYGTNNEFGFDYLRDNMALAPEQVVQGELSYAILDEVDSILIDEARTPLIISGPSEESPALYYQFARLVPQLKKDEHYAVDEKANSVTLTEEGVARAEKLLNIENLYDDQNVRMTHHLNQALKAWALMRRDRDYVVKDNQVMIVDEFTGRIMEGRRYSDGLHQAIEAKEGVKIERESQTLASITYQNLFRMYDKLAGMTGTAATEEEEFIKIYGMEVVVVPTNEPMIRDDLPDQIYKTLPGKKQAITNDIVSRHEKGQPVLVGTISIESSEELSSMLKKEGVPHQVLNAKHHEREAEIIKDAGQKGSVTIATNMAGRGTDIVLGEGVTDRGGLHILGSERHESRRIDNQLRGRSGRQGDPGSSQFFISLQDDLMRLFGSERVFAVMDRLGMDENTPVEHPLINRGIENAQKKVEARNFEIRKYVLEYDDVLNKQRQIIYNQRREILNSENVRERIMDMMKQVIEEQVELYLPKGVHPEEWDLENLIAAAERIYLSSGVLTPEKLKEMSREKIEEMLLEKARETYKKRETQWGEEIMRRREKLLALQIIDRKWMDHLDAMDDLRQGINLRAYGQRDPLVEYKFESFDLFNNMTASIREDLVRVLCKFVPRPEGIRLKERQMEMPSPEESQLNKSFREMHTNQGPGEVEKPVKKPVVKEKEVGRNDPCPCGSGKKYKKCCGR